MSQDTRAEALLREARPAVRLAEEATAGAALELDHHPLAQEQWRNLLRRIDAYLAVIREEAE